jgi:aldose sugar dehydrogenase
MQPTFRIPGSTTSKSITAWARRLTACLLCIAPPAMAAGVEEVVTGLEQPWALAFLGDGRMLISERMGRLRIVEANGRMGKTLEGLPRVGEILNGKVNVPAQGGLLDVITDRDFAINRTIYFCFSEEKNNKISTALARARLAEGDARLEKVQVIFSQTPKMVSWHHLGCRIVQAADGNLFLTLGDMQERREDAQALGTHIGKVVRVTPEGKVPAGNPYAGRSGALPENWSLGHKNIQAAAMSPSGDLWIVEHGPLGGDELNLILPGRNYGWPVITHGKEYDGRPVGKGLTQMDGMEQPVKHWPGIAPSGMTFLKSDRYGSRWKGSIVFGSLRGYVVRLEMDGKRVISEQNVWEGQGQRVRDVREAPDGTVYFLVEHPTNGKLMRLRP